MSVLIILLIALQLADILTTVYGLKLVGVREVNGLLAPVMNCMGVLPSLLLFKGLFVALLLIVRPPDSPWLWLLALYYAAVIINNCRTIIQARKSRA
ncbi:DUF5658 family protein [Vogesella oryzae]|uniref:DUF5658 family protein n=1 Tax=Vogesella oryzae TaxID=1735285 RepID=UPI0015827825|nr:DUF5658 family protein [Vogesella oryzae]